MEIKSENKKPVILFAINGLIVAGAERLYLDFFRQGFPGYELHLLTFFQFLDKKEWYDEVAPGVVVHRLDFKNFKDVRGWWDVTKILIKTRPCVIVSSLFFSNTVTRILGCMLRIPVITIEHNTYIEKTKNQQILDRILAYVTYRIVAVSKSVLEFTAHQERIPKEKFLLIHNGIDLKGIEAAARAANPTVVRAELGLKPNEHLVIAVGRLAAQKNHLALIKGFALFHKTHPDYILAIAGEGKLRNTLEDLVVERKAASYIRLLGARPDVPALHRASDFFISTSHIEGFPLAHTEALCCGIPILTTKTAGSDEMITESKNGLFFTANSDEEVAAGLEKMIVTTFDSPKEITASVSQYSIEAATAAYRELIASVVKN